jgi:hypothetical protein
MQKKSNLRPSAHITTGLIPTGLNPTGLIPISPEILKNDLIPTSSIKSRRSFFVRGDKKNDRGISPVGISPVGICPVGICPAGQNMQKKSNLRPSAHITTGLIPTGLNPTGLIPISPEIFRRPISQPCRTDIYRTETRASKNTA